MVLVSASWGDLRLIEVPIMSIWRHRQAFVDSLKREIFVFLAPIAATGVMILLWFYG